MAKRNKDKASKKVRRPVDEDEEDEDEVVEEEPEEDEDDDEDEDVPVSTTLDRTPATFKFRLVGVKDEDELPMKQFGQQANPEYKKVLELLLEVAQGQHKKYKRGQYIGVPIESTKEATRLREGIRPTLKRMGWNIRSAKTAEDGDMVLWMRIERIEAEEVEEPVSEKATKKKKVRR